MPTADEIMRILDAWASPDDWNVPSVYPSVVEPYIRALFNGMPVEACVPQDDKEDE